MPSAWQSTEYFVAKEGGKKKGRQGSTAVYRRRKAETTAGIPGKINIERRILSPPDGSRMARIFSQRLFLLSPVFSLRLVGPAVLSRNTRIKKQGVNRINIPDNGSRLTAFPCFSLSSLSSSPSSECQVFKLRTQYMRSGEISSKLEAKPRTLESEAKIAPTRWSDLEITITIIIVPRLSSFPSFSLSLFLFSSRISDITFALRNTGNRPSAARKWILLSHERRVPRNRSAEQSAARTLITGSRRFVLDP